MNKTDDNITFILKDNSYNYQGGNYNDNKNKLDIDLSDT